MAAKVPYSVVLVDDVRYQISDTTAAAIVAGIGAEPPKSGRTHVLGCTVCRVPCTFEVECPCCEAARTAGGSDPRNSHAPLMTCAEFVRRAAGRSAA